MVLSLVISLMIVVVLGGRVCRRVFSGCLGRICGLYLRLCGGLIFLLVFCLRILIFLVLVVVVVAVVILLIGSATCTLSLLLCRLLLVILLVLVLRSGLLAAGGNKIGFMLIRSVL